MDGLQFEPKMRSDKVVVKREAIADYVVDEKNGYLEEDKKNKEVVACVGKKGSSGGGSGSMRCCQVEKCKADLNNAKQYHWKHKVCEYHTKAQVVLVGGKRQWFCQQCSKFREVRIIHVIQLMSA